MKPLHGITVLDLSHAVAGPHCTHQLRLLGAHVIKVEKPGVGDDLRHYTEHSGLANLSGPFVAYNAGKQSLTLDLKKPEAHEVIARLARQADVVVENYRPGVARKLGVAWEDLREINPQLIYCSISGFGGDGPISQWPAYDHIVQAMSGLMSINGEADQGPLKVGIPLADVFSGYVAAFAILAALLQRGLTGTGQNVDVSMLDATLLLMGSQVVNYSLSGKAPARTGNAGFRLVATAGTYRTRDGHISIGANHPPQIAALLRVLGRSDLLDDARFATHGARVENGAALAEVLQAIFLEHSAAELELQLAQAQVPASMVRNLPEVLAHPQLAHRESLMELTVPGIAQPAKAMGAGFRFAHDGPHQTGTVPGIGEHADAILASLGYSAQDVARLRRDAVV